MTFSTNIVMSYPVHWSEYNVASNYVQNFVDALGYENFGSAFRCYLEEDSIVLTAKVGFAVEWLYYLGASTKRESQGENAGGFGEGFKIAALCSLRDYKLGVRMQSRDWDLVVTKVPGTIAGGKVSLLAYEVNPRPYDENTTLRLTSKDRRVLNTLYEKILDVRQDFLFQGNPVLGECLYKGEHMAIYKSMAKNLKGRPYGRLFAKRQVRADYLGPGLIFCHDCFERREDDRDRRRFYFHEVKSCVGQIVQSLPPESAYEILLCIQDFWYSPRAKESHNDDWSFFLTGLLKRMEGRRDLKKRFLLAFPSCLALPGKEWSTFERNQAMEWYRVKGIKKNRRLVHPSFHTYLGVTDVCELCEENGGLLAERDPIGTELSKIEILKEAAGVFLKGILVLSAYPPFKVIIAKNSILEGCAYERNIKGEKVVNDHGLVVVSRAVVICLREKIFELFHEQRCRPNTSRYSKFPLFGNHE